MAKIVENVKKDSLKWMKAEGVAGFTWQIGYGAFSVSASKVAVVSNYSSGKRSIIRSRAFGRK